ncbi:MAG: prepilin-type N-terminal cleavage/methylation domain-containing protein [Firmicutes bacterium]|uniref:Prepilin-type N-terminal cleavage/methylation domain-containing protein n=1 Tax=Candidatus Scybalomonas excrementavium TaxID=2840943 RepID=A0A9D9I221_9FIRM|nr:prepilin-type N-terminal cleavage/methylation domain-containing protein [Candidatus Scybalomonas excrementavium]
MMQKQQHAISGFTLTEMLVTLLLLSMTLLCIGGGVVVAKNSYDTISRKSEAQLLLSTTILSVTEELRNATNIQERTVEHNTVISFFQQQRGYQMYFRNTTSSGKKDNIYIAPVGNSGQLPLINEKVSSDSLYPQIENMTYENGIFSCTISIFYYEEPFLTQVINVRPLNETNT